jgi:hypothetical protein
MLINFKNSISDPEARDIGNKTIQGKTESKTLKFGSFTTNENAVWAARNQLRKESYPFAEISIPINRNNFDLEVGDVFYFSYSKYSISDMILRILRKEEENLDSENIILHCVQDVYSKASTISMDDYTDPTDYSAQPPDYSLTEFDYTAVFESPYVLSGLYTEIIPVVCRKNDTDLGFYIYLSTDGGTSYQAFAASSNIQPYGTLNTAYPVTNTIDDETGILIDFVDDADTIESVTWSEILSGSKNTAMLGDEMISFKDITPVSGDTYLLENVIRGRYGTVKKAHSASESFWFIPQTIETFENNNLIATGAALKFKLVPYNIKKQSAIADVTAIDITIEGESRKPYEPLNFFANGRSFSPSYVSGNDIVLTWSARVRLYGCGIGQRGVPLNYSGLPGHEGYFEIKVYVSDVLVRTTTAIDAVTWTYTNTMNVSDNGTPANEIVFKITNYDVLYGVTHASDQVTVTCKKE